MAIELPNCTEIPNQIIDDLPLLTQTEVKVILVIFRWSGNWHSAHESLSLEQIASLSGIKIAAVTEATESLVERGFIRATRGNNYEANKGE